MGKLARIVAFSSFFAFSFLSCPVADEGIALDPPTGLSARPAMESGSIVLSWVATSSATFNGHTDGDSFSYEIFMSTEGSNAYFSLVLTVQGALAPENSCTITGLQAGGTYYFKIKAVNDVLESAFSEVVSAMPNSYLREMFEPLKGNPFP